MPNKKITGLSSYVCDEHAVYFKTEDIPTVTSTPLRSSPILCFFCNNGTEQSVNPGRRRPLEKEKSNQNEEDQYTILIENILVFLRGCQTYEEFLKKIQDNRIALFVNAMGVEGVNRLLKAHNERELPGVVEVWAAIQASGAATDISGCSTVPVEFKLAEEKKEMLHRSLMFKQYKGKINPIFNHSLSSQVQGVTLEIKKELAAASASPPSPNVPVYEDDDDLIPLVPMTSIKLTDAEVAYALGYPQCALCEKYFSQDSMSIRHEVFGICSGCNTLYIDTKVIELYTISHNMMVSAEGEGRRRSSFSSARSTQDHCNRPEHSSSFCMHQPEHIWIKLIANEVGLKNKILMLAKAFTYPEETEKKIKTKVFRMADYAPENKIFALSERALKIARDTGQGYVSFPPILYLSRCEQAQGWLYRHKWIIAVGLIALVMAYVVYRAATPSLSPPPSPSPPPPWAPKQRACRGVNVTSILPATPSNAEEAAQVLFNYTAAFGAQLMRDVASLCAAQGMLGINASYRFFINACETLQRNFSGLTTQNVEGIFSNWPNQCALPPTPPPPSPPNPPSPPPSPPNPPSPPPSPPNPPSPPPSPPNPPPSPAPPPAACDALGKPIANITQFTDGIKALQTIATTLLPSAPDTVVLKRILDWCVIDPNVGFKYLADYCAYLASLNPTGTVGLILQMARYCLNRH